MYKPKKVRVIGWTHYESDYCDTMFDYGDACNAVEKCIQENGYRIYGNEHQQYEGCCPILNDGGAFRCSMREWGGVMVEAVQPQRQHDEEGFEYMEWYHSAWITEESVLPPEGVDESQIDTFVFYN